MPNDLAHVRRVMAMLEQHGITTWLFGGWAEELHGLFAQRSHRDVDLLYRAANFAVVDRFLRQSLVHEIVDKRLSHKRAFVLDGVMTEIILVRPNFTTIFHNQKRFVWPTDTFESPVQAPRVASLDALAAYRSAHDVLHSS